MANITVKMKDGSVREFPHKDRPGGSYTKTAKYEGAGRAQGPSDEALIVAADTLAYPHCVTSRETLLARELLRLKGLQGESTAHPASAELVQALRSYEQLDPDGVFVKVSRQACDEAAAALSAGRGGATGYGIPLTLDDERRVFFYEQDHYYLSNFSAFKVEFDGRLFDTAENAYHFQRFTLHEDRAAIICAESAHAAFRYAQENKSRQRPEWDSVKVDTMRQIIRAKAEQHEYVRRKLLQTGDRELIENSWRDPFWGWGENRDGENMLGKLWMEVRGLLRLSGLQGGKP